MCLKISMEEEEEEAGSHANQGRERGQKRELKEEA